MNRQLPRILTVPVLLLTSLAPISAQQAKTKPKPAAAAGSAGAKPTPAPATAAAAAPRAKPSKVELEPLCLVLEPAVLKTKSSQVLPGARKTVVTPAKETKHGLVLLEEDAVAALGLDWPKLQAKAVAAASRHLKTLTPEISRDEQGAPRYALLHSERPFHTSILLCPEFGEQFEKEFGKDFVVMAPDRFSVYVFQRHGDFQQYAARLAELHTTAVYPASAEAFQWSKEGLKALGELVGAEEPSSPKP